MRTIFISEQIGISEEELNDFMRRVNCPDCGVRVEQVPWARGKHELADTYRQFLAHWDWNIEICRA